MTESEKFDLILAEIKGVKSEMQDMKTEMQDMKTEMKDMQTQMQKMDSQLQGVDQRLTSLVLHVENGTDKNIQLVAENFVELTKKLNEAIPVADSRLAYEVKVNYAIDELNKLKKEVEDLKSRIA